MSIKENNYRMRFWESEWKENRTIWHIDEVNPILKKYENKLIPSEDSGATVLFPLCGKTLDMKYFLDKNFNVLGIEGVETVVLEYFNESNIKYEIINVSHNGNELKVFVAGKLTIICGNFFITEPLQPANGIPEYATHKVDAVFDRGSMIAILPNLRNDYIKVLQKWVKSSGRLLLYAPEFDQTLREGPPFIISELQVNEAYEGIANIELLETINKPMLGVDKVLHRNWLIIFH